MQERTLRFQQKLWHIVSTCHTGAVSWSENGDSIIFKFSQFKKEFLDRNLGFCKSSKIASFVRQLNLYGFRKLVQRGSARKKHLDIHEFKNIYFKRGRQDLLDFVVRSSTTPGIMKRSNTGSENFVKRRGRKGRGRGRKPKYDKTIKVEEVYPCPKIKTEHQSPDRFEDDKENGFSQDEKCTTIKNEFDERKLPSPKKEKQSKVLWISQQFVGNHDKTKMCELSKLIAENAQKPYNFENLKKEFQSKTSPHKAEEITTKIEEKKTLEGNFPNIEDDFEPASNEQTSSEDEDDDFYKNMMESSRPENYVSVPVKVKNKTFSWYNLKANNSFVFYDVPEYSIEYLELLASYANMNGIPKPHTQCVCNPNIAPSWIMPFFLR